MTEDITLISTNPIRFLFSDEEQIVVGNFRDYLLTKRFNFVASINNLRDLADLYFKIDETWVDAMKTIELLSKREWIVPVQLTIFCFREIRMAAELLFCCCTTPGNSHLRSAIESFVHAQKILKEPGLIKVWLSRDSDRAEYDRYFKANFKANLFPKDSGFEHLHSLWQMLCEVGPHPNVNSLGLSSSVTTTASEAFWRLEFFETGQDEIAKNLLLMIQCALEMFKSTYSSFHEQLSSNPALLKRLTNGLVDLGLLKRKYLGG